MRTATFPPALPLRKETVALDAVNKLPPTAQPHTNFLFLTGGSNVKIVSKPFYLRSLFLVLFLGSVFFVQANIAAQEADITFDAPALISVREFVESPLHAPTPVAAASTDSAHQVGYRGVREAGEYRKAVYHKTTPELDGQRSNQASEKIIEVVVPVTSELSRHSKQTVESFRFDVYWNRVAFPLSDYAPKTQTVSEVAGVISIETNDEDNAGFRLGVNGKYESYLTGNLNADFSNRNATKKRFEEIPDHDILVASGTSHRGTGAFFRFHPSKQDTLEGGRDLILAFRVPIHWRAGILKIECHAEGQQRVFASWKEDFEYGRAFIVPIYVDGDEDARQATVELVRAEQRLRKLWNKRSMSRNESRGFFSIPSTQPAQLPKDWVHRLIQSGDDDYLEKHRIKLPNEVAKAADQFVAARQTVLQMGR